MKVFHDPINFSSHFTKHFSKIDINYLSDYWSVCVSDESKQFLSTYFKVVTLNISQMLHQRRDLGQKVDDNETLRVFNQRLVQIL